jgi:hypothetical protein
MARRFVGVAFLIFALHLVLCHQVALAADAPAPAQGGYIFVPVYSHILIGDNARPFPLAVTLCLRNTSLNEEIRLLSVDYYDSEGGLLKKYLDVPEAVRGLGSLIVTVAESEKYGGAGAKFVVTWSSAKPVAPPLAEAVMIGTSNQQGISFTSRGEAHPLRP